MNIHFVEEAAHTAESLLAPLRNRWLHVQGVVEKAFRVGEFLEEEDRLYLIVAAYLHDVGYAPSLNRTDFHPLDGAAYIMDTFKNKRLASLIAYHSEAYFEAYLRGYEFALTTFHQEISPVADALTYCDMTTSPTGSTILVEERIAEILSRYGEHESVSQAIHEAAPFLFLAVERTEHLLQKRN